MTESAPMRNIKLDNGLRLEFFDRSNRYFGDFHRVLIEVLGSMAPSAHLPAELRDYLAVSGDSVLYRLQLERMGVTTAQLEETREELMDSFLDSVGGYLGHPDMPARLLRKLQTERNPRHR